MDNYINLFNIAKEIQELEPWNYLLDVNKLLFTKDGEIVLFSVLGSAGFFYGIVIYEGLKNIYEFQKFSEKRVDLTLERHYVKNQNYSLCRYVRAKDLNELDKYIYVQQKIKLNDYSFYPSFVTQKKGFLPKEIQPEDTQKIKYYLSHFKEMLTEIINRKITFSLCENDFIIRKYCSNKKEWINEVGNNFQVVPPRYNPPILNKIEIQKLLNGRRLNCNLILDYRYLENPVISDEITDAYFPQLIVALDLIESQVIKIKLCNPSQDILESSYQLLMTIVRDYGIPLEIKVVHEELFHYLVDVCSSLKVKLELCENSQESDYFFGQFNKFNQFQSSFELNYKNIM